VLQARPIPTAMQMTVASACSKPAAQGPVLIHDEWERMVAMQATLAMTTVPTVALQGVALQQEEALPSPGLLSMAAR
jgi:hypothetical protein